MSSLTELSIKEIKAGIKSKKFTAQEVSKECLEAAKRNSKLNAFISLTEEKALADAKAADEAAAKGIDTPLLGSPVAVKDMILTKDIRTTAGSKILENYLPPYNATVTINLARAGAPMIGKTNLDEFAMGSSNEHSFFGPVLNPWDHSRVPGGSSGGSAAAVAAGICRAALGTDTGGSIRQPASLCGIVGIKPTYGRVSRHGVIAYASSLDQVGTFAKTVEDCALVTEVICGFDPSDSTSVDKPVPDLSKALNRGVKGLRIGVPREYFIPGMDQEVSDSIKKALKVLEGNGAELVDISLPHTDAAVAVYYIIAPAEASSNLARYDGIRYGHRASDAKELYDVYCRSRSEGFGREVQRRILTGTYVLSTGYYEAYYLKAQRVRTLIAKDFTEAFKACDVIAAPASPTTAFKIGENINDPLQMYLTDIFTIPVNLAGLPGMSVPCGFSSESLPIGLQLIGKPWDEETLFAAAYNYEQATDWHKRSPGK